MFFLLKKEVIDMLKLKSLNILINVCYLGILWIKL